MDHESLDPSLVRIRRIDGGVVGVGFLVGERDVLTCAHVVALASGQTKESVDLPVVSIVLDFPRLAPRTRLAARVICWRPVRDDGGGDIAVLKLLGDPPTGARAVHFTLAEDVWEHPFRAFGFPDAYDEGVWATGHLLGRQANDWLVLEDVKTEGFAVVEGFSGGPVWDTTLQGVVGMIATASLSTQTKTAFVIPFDVLMREWPGIQPVLYQRVFLSSAPGDMSFAGRLRTDLQARGVVVWDELNGPAHTNPETDAQERLRQAVLDTQVVLLVVSSQTWTSHIVKKHLRMADLYQRRLILVLVGDEEKMQSLSAGWRDTTWVDARKTPYEAVLTHIEAALSQSRSLAELFEPKDEAEQEPRNPYKGLRPFTADDVGDFFGRERLIHEMVNDVAALLAVEPRETKSERCLTIIGPSGSGKSSVVMAGLLPQLRRRAVSGSDMWVYLEPMVPGKHPIEALALTLKPFFPNSSFKTLREDLDDDATRGLYLLATQIAKERASKVVLLVDQFEEVFTQTETEDERQRFIDLLLTATTAPSGPLLVLLTLRADFYDRPMHYPPLSSLIQKHQRQVLPMDMEDLRAIIEQPAALPDVHLSFEGNMVGDLLFEMQGQVGALPLLQFTLERLYEDRDGHRLTLQAYRKMGGIKGALSQHAEETYTTLPSDAHRRLARTLFLRLIEPGDSEQEMTRRRAALSELTSYDTTQNRLMHETIDAFIAARLLTGNEIAGTTTLEVSHEAVLREWKLPGNWLREAHDDIRLQRVLNRDATEWVRRKQPRDRLYRGVQLKEAKAWVRRNKPSEQEITFLQASIKRQIHLIIVVLLLLLLVGMGGIGALFRLDSRFVITSSYDGGVGSLRYCINNAPSGSTIRFAPWVKGTIELTGGSLLFPSDKNLTINGSGASQLTISGGNRNAPVQVSKGATVNISGLSFKNSQTIDKAFIQNEGTLTLTNSVIAANKTARGAFGYGGGIYNSETGLLIIETSIFSDNSVYGDTGGLGGGIDNKGKLTVVNSTFSENKALGGKRESDFANAPPSSQSGGNRIPGYGGGIHNSSNGTTLVKSSTFSSNSADGLGGGISNEGELTVVNSTFSGNKAFGSNGSGGYGGGINNGGPGTAGTAIIRFSTFYQNTSDTGGGIWTHRTKGGGVTISDSIVAANGAQNSPNMAKGLISEGYNLIENVPDTQRLDITDRQVAFADLKIDPMLRNNGGLTQTLRLLPGSPALDAIPRNRCDITITDAFGHTESITTDQRGSPRLHRSKNVCDIGAI